MSQTIDVFGVGNAMVDILVMIPDTFLVEHELAKGAMTLVDAQLQGKRAQRRNLGPMRSVCWTDHANLAKLGGKIPKVTPWRSHLTFYVGLVNAQQMAQSLNP